MATLSTAAAARAGVELVAGAVACSVGGDVFTNTGEEVLFLTNTGGLPITVSIAHQDLVDGRAVAARTVVVDGGSVEAIGPFPVGLYSDANGLTHLSYSSVANLYARVLQVHRA